jgi:two-component system, NarL family, sensor kinase
MRDDRAPRQGPRQARHRLVQRPAAATPATTPAATPGEDPGVVVAADAEDLHRPTEFVVLASGRASAEPALATHRVAVPVLAAVAAVLVAIGLGAVAARWLAEGEAVRDASERADLIVNAALEPVLTDQFAAGDPAARAALDRVVRGQVLGRSVSRVKIWSADGQVLYSDETQLVGKRFALSEDDREALADGRTRAEVTDLRQPENRFERGQGKLLEVYRRVETRPSRTPLLFETYSPYDEVSRRTGQLWWGFTGLLVATLVLLVLLLLPVLWRVQDRITKSQDRREALLRRAVDASQAERRRIAGTLHDGVVQELAATSFALAGGVERAEREGSRVLAAQLREAAATVRGSIGGLRSLLVDIYPPSLASAGLTVALQDLVGPLRARDIDVRLELPAAADQRLLDQDGERLVFRIAHECLVNVAKHSAASRVLVRLRRVGNEVVLDIVDDGVGFDAGAVTSAPPEGHLGLRVMADLAQEAGATLAVSSAPEEGTWWQLRIRPS